MAMFALLYPWAESAAQLRMGGQFRLDKPLVPGEDGEAERQLALTKSLIAEGRLDEALGQLDQIEITPKTETDITFLRGQIAQAKGDFKTAVRHYRVILGSRPELVRVRLELGKMLFLLGEDDASRHHFELARGADPPPAVLRNIDQFMTAMRNRKKVRYSLELSLVPDTNVNAATDVSEVTIPGFPTLKLNDDAKRTSGVGISVKAQVDLTYPLVPGTNLEAGAGLRRNDYKNRDFDDTNVIAFAGIRRYFMATDVGIRASGARRWFGGEPYSYSLGGRLDIGHRLTPQWHGRLTLGAQRVRYDQSTRLNGPVYHAQAQVSHALSADSRIYLVTGALREDADDPADANTAPFLGVGYEKELLGRLRIGLHPLVYYRRFDGDSGLGGTRRETILQFRGRVTYRKDLLFGFAPALTYTYTRNNANISLHDYVRHQLAFALTKEF